MTTSQPVRTALYAYAFVTTNTHVPDGLVGIGPRHAPVRVLDRAGLGVLVSDIDATRLSTILDEDVTEQSELAVRAREHDHVIRTAFERGPVLPFRFGTVLQDLAATDQLLAAQHDSALARLRHVDGRQEWAVRLHAQASSRGEPSDVDRSSGMSYLAGRGRRLRDLDERRANQRAVADEISTDLASWAADTVDRRSGRAVLDLAVLVDRTATDDFLDHLGQLAVPAADTGLLLDTTGPWPAYSFTGTAVEVSHD
ncbi:MAG TPA: GvpL/GvpF family gas vesicle protein [Pseudonocardiaceae bacterium]|jgi:hypothetical protein|nr:GvpL/GvpF family gas vesicle protein [Pseudonocardiaceae bacterium]